MVIAHTIPQITFPLSSNKLNFNVSQTILGSSLAMTLSRQLYEVVYQPYRPKSIARKRYMRVQKHIDADNPELKHNTTLCR
jgi:hypothetical protein